MPVKESSHSREWLLFYVRVRFIKKLASEAKFFMKRTLSLDKAMFFC